MNTPRGSIACFEAGDERGRARLCDALADVPARSPLPRSVRCAGRGNGPMSHQSENEVQK